MSEFIKSVDLFSRDAVSRAQRNLGAYRYVVDRNGRKKRRRADSSGELRKSLTYVLKENSDGTINVRFRANGTAGNYANFVEQGVNGTRKRWGSPFSFKGKNINQKAVRKWMQRKPLRVREFKNGKLGGFTQATESKKRQAAFLIGRSIARYGFAPLNYMRDAVNGAMNDWGQRMADAYAQDIAQEIGNGTNI